MTNFKLGRWLLVAVALVGLAIVAPVVSAHGNETTADDAPPYDGSAADVGTWMEGHMTDQMGPDAVGEMESHMGVTVDEMAQNMADDNHSTGGMTGQGYGC